MQKAHDYRPEVHFTPPVGWTNDPNGMVYVDGKYHIFYQHYPKECVWGPMHWGHAISEDLLHWKHLPIAIYPDELGMVFSGSAVLDVENVSGLGSKENPPLIAMYTSHKGSNHQEQQSIAYSLDYEHFEKYYGNPVIPNVEKKDFRDPKMFWNPVKKCISVALAAGESIEFYSSKNFKEWEKTGEFKAGEHGLGGICECPDCFPLMTEDGEKWVLIISMILADEDVKEDGDVTNRMSHITQYYVGEFDGDTFIDTEKYSQPLVLDYGTDNYAAVTFQNLDEKVLLGWGDNWDYAGIAPTAKDGFRGKMTLARKMRLVKTKVGYRLAFSYEGLESLKTTSYPLAQGVNRLRTQTFGMQVEAKGEGCIEIANSINEKIKICVTGEEILIDRIHAGQKEFSEHYKKDSYGLNKAPIMKNGNLDIVFDRSILEVLGDDGLAPFTVNVYPTRPYEMIQVTGSLQVQLYEIK